MITEPFIKDLKAIFIKKDGFFSTNQRQSDEMTKKNMKN